VIFGSACCTYLSNAAVVLGDNVVFNCACNVNGRSRAATVTERCFHPIPQTRNLIRLSGDREGAVSPINFTSANRIII
jgi:hypothetical protein